MKLYSGKEVITISLQILRDKGKPIGMGLPELWTDLVERKAKAFGYTIDDKVWTGTGTDLVWEIAGNINDPITDYDRAMRGI